jgi:hypothetical protein
MCLPLQGCPLLLSIGDRSEQGWDLGPARLKFQEPRGGARQHRPGHVATRTLGHPRHPRRDPPDRHRLPLRCAQA